MARKNLWLVTLAVLVMACASSPPPRPYVAESAVIGISIEERAPIKLFHGHPDRVFFVRLDDDQGLFQSQVVPSNYSNHGHLYLLNVKPGQYAAVAALSVKTGTPYSRSTSYMTYFAKELIEETKVTVGANQIVFMGSYVIDDAVGLGGADEVQKHYAELIAPGPKNVLLDILSGEYSYRGTLHEKEHGEQSKELFLKDARVDLAASGWDSVFH